MHVDVPLATTPPGEIAIRIVDLSKLTKRPIDPPHVQQLLEVPPNALREVAVITKPDLAAHADWSALGFPGGTAVAGFEIYLDRAGRYRWRLRRPDGQIVADGGQSYRLRADCESDLRWIKQNGINAPVFSKDLK